MPHPLRRVRQYFIVGLVVVTPLGATIFVLAWAFRTIDAILGRPLEQSLGVRVPGLGIAILGLLVLLVGWAVHPILSDIVGEPCLTVFLPTTFSVPPSGYLLIFPTARVRPLDLTVEDAFKFVVSAGAVLPTGAAPAAGLDLTKLLGGES